MFNATMILCSVIVEHLSHVRGDRGRHLLCFSLPLPSATQTIPIRAPRNFLNVRFLFAYGGSFGGMGRVPCVTNPGLGSAVARPALRTRRRA